MRRLLFVTGTRADWSKMAPLVRAAREAEDFEVTVFATGQHLDDRWGRTVVEIEREFEGEPWAVYRVPNGAGHSMDQLTQTLSGMHSLVRSIGRPDMVLVHGDRMEPFAAAQVATAQEPPILVGHIEGGELSGTVDEGIRHAITKLAHVHFVANEDAFERLRSMGEWRQAIHIIGSPEVDVMCGELPSMAEVRGHYDLPIGEYGILIYHPVATLDGETQALHASAAVRGCKEQWDLDWIVLEPNSDPGREHVVRALDEMPGRYRFPSMRHPHFLRLLQGAEVVVGNSSTGVREAPVYGVPSVDIGPRQQGRVSQIPTVVQAGPGSVVQSIRRARQMERVPTAPFGDPGVAERFI